MIALDLAKMLSGIDFSRIPEEAKKKTVQCVSDFIGVFLGGKHFHESKALRDALREKYDEIPTTGSTALWIASVGRLLDFDDGHRRAMGHPGVPVISTALAMARRQGASGVSFMEAVVRGYEAYCFIGPVINPKAYLERGFDATGICGAVGAAAVASTILAFDEKKMADAIAIAASLCGGLNQYTIDGGSPKYLCAGWAAKLGVESALIAQNGLTGPLGIFEGEKGYCQGFAVDYDRSLLENPRVSWAVESVYLKRFACVRRLHAALDIVDDAMRKEGILAKNIRRIDVYGSHFIAESAKYDPADETLAQTSMPFAIALLLKYGEVTIERIKENIGNADVSRLSRLVHIFEDESFNDLLKEEKGLWGAARVNITTEDGREVAGERKYALGEREAPLPEELLRHKFMNLATKSVSEEQAEKIFGELEDLVSIENMSETVSRIID